ncbi:MAG: DUF2147 domain-containing protein [Bacteroidota bacterium]
MNIVFKKSLLLFVAVFLSFISFAQGDADKIIGVWKNGEGTGMIKIYKTGENYQGKIVWLKETIDPETGKPKLDKNNPEESLRSRAVIGIINTWGFVYKGENAWDDGKIYDPKTGNIYDCIIKMKNDNTLDVRGYIGISLIGRTDTWTRQVAK